MKIIRQFLSEVYHSIVRYDTSFNERGWSEKIFNNLFLHLHPVKTRIKAIDIRYTLCLGGIALALFIILSISGLLLMFYYHPSVPQAYNDMKDLEFVVSSGVFWRNIHRWSAHGMVLAVFFHMCRVFFTGAYKPPRQFNWVVGIGLLLLTLGASFTGYLLPWDQLSFWAITVGTTIAGYAPIIGNNIRFILLGGNYVGENALLRFYVLHCFLIPMIIGLLMCIHFWRIRKDGGISGPL